MFMVAILPSGFVRAILLCNDAENVVRVGRKGGADHAP